VGRETKRCCGISIPSPNTTYVTVPFMGKIEREKERGSRDIYPVSIFTKHALANHPYVVPTGQIDKAQKAQKMAVVVVSYAVVHPWTLSFFFDTYFPSRKEKKIGMFGHG
jgi:hypothetical protein